MKKTITIILIVLASVAVLGAAAAGAYFGLNTFVGDEVIPVSTVELDLSGKNIEPVELKALERCEKLENLDIRGINITVRQFDELQALLPECDILWSVPVGMERFDSNITEFSMAAEYASDLDNLRYFTGLTSADVTGTKADDEQLYELNRSLPGIELYWTVTINEEEYPTETTTELDFSKTVLSDPSVLKCFPNLTRLSLAPKTITDLSVLEGLTKLEYLDIGGNQCTDISALSGMTELVELDLSDTWSNDGNKDLTPLAGLTKLEVLNLNHCNGENYEVIAGLPALREVNLTYFGGSSTDYSFFSQMTSLEKLDLTYSGMLNSDFEYLAPLTSLKELDLKGIYVTDPSALHSLVNLEKLVIRSEGISKEDRNALTNALPNCKITWD